MIGVDHIQRHHVSHSTVLHAMNCRSYTQCHSYKTQSRTEIDNRLGNRQRQGPQASPVPSHQHQSFWLLFSHFCFRYARSEDLYCDYIKSCMHSCIVRTNGWLAGPRTCIRYYFILPDFSIFLFYFRARYHFLIIMHDVRTWSYEDHITRS